LKPESRRQNSVVLSGHPFPSCRNNQLTVRALPRDTYSVQVSHHSSCRFLAWFSFVSSLIVAEQTVPGQLHFLYTGDTRWAFAALFPVAAAQAGCAEAEKHHNSALEHIQSFIRVATAICS
jgi:hypothetical protein